MSTLKRHFTASGYVVFESKILLHWHKKVKAYLPPGGHIEENEDPVEAVLREIKEETGLRAKICNRQKTVTFSYPRSISIPEQILIEDIEDPIEGLHHHIDLIYFCSISNPTGLKKNWYWFDKDSLKRGLIHGPELVMKPPPDVAELGNMAIDAVG